jgi:hypothetical protein
VRQGLTEANPRIDNNLFLGNSRLVSTANALRQKVSHLSDDIFVARLPLHGSRHALHVHENERHAFTGNERRHRRIKSQRADIIDDVGTRVQSGAGDSFFVGIDGNRHAGSFTQLSNHRKNAP